MGRLAEVLKAQPKYRARATSCGLHVHASKKEAGRCVELRLLHKAGEICSLEFQPRYDLVVNGTRVAKYFGDFRYRMRQRDGTWSDIILEDVKSPASKTPLYRLKKKLVKCLYDIDILETT